MRHLLIGSGLAALLATVAAAPVLAQEYKAKLDGFFEIGALNNSTGAVFTTGTGKLTLVVDRNSARYSLTYSGLTSKVLQAHLHFGKVHVAGGIYAYLCTNLNNVPAGAPAAPPCPEGGGTVTGTLTAANILGITLPQNNQVFAFPKASFDALLAALSSDTTYVNVHTANFPTGEIRGQTQQRGDDDEDEGKGRDR